MTDTVSPSTSDGAEPKLWMCCPKCGSAAQGMMCGGCGANLSYSKLITRSDWEARHETAKVEDALDRAALEVIVSTMNDLPGYQILEVHGEVFGLTARARNVLANVTANVRTVVGGEVGSYTKLLSDSRDDAVARLRRAAAEKGANAVLAMRFDANELHDVISEVVAYGTAVHVERK
jgi:uncharacterized protein YbjQ (UPF0145 family)